MNRTVRYWLIATGLTCALAGALVLAIENDDNTCFFGYCGFFPLRGIRVQLQAAAAHERRLITAYRAATDLALAARVLPTTPAVGEPAIWFAQELPEAIRRTVRAAIDSERAVRAPWRGRSRSRIGVLVLADTASKFEGRSVQRGSPVDVRSLYPSAATGGRCITVIRLRAGAVREGVTWSRSRPLLDACSLLDAFGPPGPAIAAALDSGAYHAARLYTPAAPDTVRRSRALYAIASSYDLPMYRCAVRDDVDCAELVHAAISRRPREDEFSYWTGQRLVDPPFATDENNRWQRGAFMDAIAADLGPARFEKFWKSTAPVLDAYREASGRSIGDLIRGYVGVTLFGERPRTGFGMRGTNTASATIGSSALIVAFIFTLLVAATRASQRPTVT